MHKLSSKKFDLGLAVDRWTMIITFQLRFVLFIRPNHHGLLMKLDGPLDSVMVHIKSGGGALVLLIRRPFASIEIRQLEFERCEPVRDIEPNKLNDYFLGANYVAGDCSFIEIQGSLYRESDDFQFRAITMDKVLKSSL
ncbi:hypothetical protein GQX74_002537 [Glossina fuscipes]|nr:hypothetical protein GQX74_002537 [Glossina fuscipes]